MINPSGDLIVRPTFIEAAAQVMRPWGETLQLAHSYTGSPLTPDLPHEHVGHCLALMTAYFPQLLLPKTTCSGTRFCWISAFYGSLLACLLLACLLGGTGVS